ncbi:podocalyxin-like protein 2 isoform X4 [Canis lupus dingo]|uniref:podocalyxin-like protein 2 isoform X4 n=1 Tax=Canis lupus dingo TaxID=286419 RepID=UPI0020C2ECEC|nr:podocalyxin-like protein 2 isoform X4 [Canis lupus dingo]
MSPIGLTGGANISTTSHVSLACPPRAAVWQPLLEPSLTGAPKEISDSALSLDLPALSCILRPQDLSEMGLHMKNRPVFAGKLVPKTLPMVRQKKGEEEEEEEKEKEKVKEEEEEEEEEAETED